MEAVSLEAEIDTASNKYNFNFFRNNATPGGVLSTEQKLDQETSKRFADDWNNKF